MEQNRKNRAGINGSVPKSVKGRPRTSFESRREGPSLAFTLVEALVVLAILSIVAAMLLPGIGRARQKAQTADCLGNLRSLGVAMAMYSQEQRNLLPMAHAEAAWTNQHPPPWTRPLLPYYETTKVLICPAYTRLHRRSPFNYFMGGRVAFIEAGGQPASVHMDRIQFPSQYVLSGDCNFPFNPSDADPDNYTFDTLFGTNCLGHAGRVNVLFGDSHAASAPRFDPATMTYSYSAPGTDWDGWDF